MLVGNVLERAGPDFVVELLPSELEHGVRAVQEGAAGGVVLACARVMRVHAVIRGAWGTRQLLRRLALPPICLRYH